MSSNEKNIIAENITFKYSNNDNNVLDGVNLKINQGEYVSIIGRNGCGKTTFVKLLNALNLPDSGIVSVYGRDTKDEQNVYPIREDVALLFQNPENQIVNSFVEEEVAFGPENLGLDREEIIKRVDYALSAVGAENLRYKEVQHLSGGQKQRIAIAGLLAMKPNCLILDEGTSMLDPNGRSEILQVIENLNNNENITIIHITHNMEEALKTHRTIVFDEGKIVADGTPAEIFSNTEFLREKRLEQPIISSLLTRLSNELDVEIDMNYSSTKQAAENVYKSLFASHIDSDSTTLGDGSDR